MDLEVPSSVFWSYPQALHFSFLKSFKSFNTFASKFINEFNALANFAWDKPRDMWDKSLEMWDQVWELWDKPRTSKDIDTQPKYMVFQPLKWAKSGSMSHLGQRKWAASPPICETNHGGKSQKSVQVWEKLWGNSALAMSKTAQLNPGLREFADLTDNTFIWAARKFSGRTESTNQCRRWQWFQRPERSPGLVAKPIP